MSNDDRPLFEALLAAQQTREAVALATVIRTQGSVPRQAGAKMLVYRDGRIQGTIGGGEMESLVISAAREALRDGQTRVVPYSLVDPGRGDPGVCGGNLEIYVEPYLPQTTLFVIGCGHVGRSLASLGKWLPMRVVVYDDRAELATPENIPDADVYLTGDFAEALEVQPIDSETFVALVTRNVGLDRHLLPPLLASPAAYIGVMGSRRRWQETRRLLLEDGVAENAVDRVVSPIGLELNAETPNEIAVSIMAQILMVQRDGTGAPMTANVKTGAAT